MIIIFSSPCARSFNTISKIAQFRTARLFLFASHEHAITSGICMYTRKRRNAIVGKGHFRGKDYVQDRTNRGVRSVTMFITGKSSNPLGSTAVNLDASDAAVDEALPGALSHPFSFSRLGFLFLPFLSSFFLFRSMSLRCSTRVVRAGRTQRKLAY